MFFSLSEVAREWSIWLSTPSMAKIKHRMMVLSAWEVWRATCTHQINHHLFSLYIIFFHSKRAISFFPSFLYVQHHVLHTTHLW